MLQNQLHRPEHRRRQLLRPVLGAGPIRLAALCLLTAAGTPAAAESLSAFIPAGEIADAPAGFVDMCHRDRTLCEAGMHPVEQTPGVAAPLGSGARSLAAVDRRSTVGGDAVSEERSMFAAFDGCRRAIAPAERPGFGSVLATRYLTLSYSATPAGLAGPAPNGASCEGRDRAVLGGYGGMVTAALLTPVEPVSAPAVPAQATEMRAERDLRPALKLLRHVNLSVNGSVFQQSDLQHNGVEEYWERPDRVHPIGDCEDIAIEKRMRLVEAGFAPSKLFFAVAYSSRFGLHTVLIARLTDADYVLDSLTADLLRWSQVRYRWLRVQSTTDPMVWTRVRMPGEALAATTAADVPVAARDAEPLQRALAS